MDYIDQLEYTNYYHIADLIIRMACFGETLKRQGRPYLMDKPAPADITITLPPEKLKLLQEKYPHLTLNDVEYIQTGFAFSRALLEFDGFCLHASAVALNNRAVLFSAPCGTGKSTHAGLWQKHFGADKALILNDDKPALRLLDDTFYVYGTPWSGKTDLSLNLKVPLQTIVFLEQAQENSIRRLNNKEGVQWLVYQSLRPVGDRNKMNRLLILLDNLLKKFPVYHLGCTVSTQGVDLVYRTINKERNG